MSIASEIAASAFASGEVMAKSWGPLAAENLWPRRRLHRAAAIGYAAASALRAHGSQMARLLFDNREVGMQPLPRLISRGPIEAQKSPPHSGLKSIFRG